MQINSINNQNSFGLKFGPKLKDDFRIVAENIFGNKRLPKNIKDAFERQITSMKAMFPDGILERRLGYVGGTPLTKSAKSNKLEYMTYINEPTIKVVLARGTREDEVLHYSRIDRVIDIQDINTIYRGLIDLKKAEDAAMKNPMKRRAIERAKKLLA